MPIITSLTPQTHDKSRCNVEVDGRFFCGMALETVILNRLKVGSSVSYEALSAMQLESEKSAALDKALTHLTASQKTERDTRLFLQRKGYVEEVIDYVVEKLREYGYLDDTAYAVSYTEAAKKGKGSRLIAAELKRKGLSEEAISAAMEGVGDELEGATRVLQKYLRGKEIDEKMLKKAYSYLISKGYDYDTARSALAALKGEE